MIAPLSKIEIFITEENDMNTNKHAARTLANNIILEIDSKLENLEADLMDKPYPTVKATESEREIFKAKIKNVCDTVAIFCTQPRYGHYDESDAIIREASHISADVENDSESFQPINFVFIVRKMSNILFFETDTYDALISLCKIMAAYYKLNLDSYIQYFKFIFGSFGQDNILTAKYFENKLAKTFYYSAGLEPDKSTYYANIITFLMHKQTNNIPLEKGNPVLNHLIATLNGLANEIVKTDEDKAEFIFNFVSIMQTNPVNCHLISIYDALLSRWTLIDKCIYTYEIVFDLIMLKDNWEFTYTELLKLNKLLLGID